MNHLLDSHRGTSQYKIDNTRGCPHLLHVGLSPKTIHSECVSTTKTWSKHRSDYHVRQVVWQIRHMLAFVVFDANNILADLQHTLGGAPCFKNHL